MDSTEKTTLVVTSISPPNNALRALADGAHQVGWDFIVIGDVGSPADFYLRGCRFLSVDAQLATGLAFARTCPMRHYARKNIGYLMAIREGAERIVEADDDNVPRPEFFSRRSRRCMVPLSTDDGWVNAYRWFTDVMIWPRGLPLESVPVQPTPLSELVAVETDCLIQQGLVDENPDVDAIYRLILPLPQSFRTDVRVALGAGSWSPFNSQNTIWWRDAFPLLYLPAYCSFRMTDIWRSFVAQRIAWENGWSVLFHEPTMLHRRNAHDLTRDFEDEVPGYLYNGRIGTALATLSLKSGIAHLGSNLRICYGKLVEMNIVGSDELPLLDAWLADVEYSK
jgi:hypothetical protein